MLKNENGQWAWGLNNVSSRKEVVEYGWKNDHANFMSALSSKRGRNDLVTAIFEEFPADEQVAFFTPTSPSGV